MKKEKKIIIGFLETIERNFNAEEKGVQIDLSPEVLKSMKNNTGYTKTETLISAFLEALLDNAKTKKDDDAVNQQDFMRNMLMMSMINNEHEKNDPMTLTMLKHGMIDPTMLMMLEQSKKKQNSANTCSFGGTTPASLDPNFNMAGKSSFNDPFSQLTHFNNLMSNDLLKRAPLPKRVIAEAETNGIDTARSALYPANYVFNLIEMVISNDDIPIWPIFGDINMLCSFIMYVNERTLTHYVKALVNKAVKHNTTLEEISKAFDEISNSLLTINGRTLNLSDAKLADLRNKISIIKAHFKGEYNSLKGHKDDTSRFVYPPNVVAKEIKSLIEDDTKPVFAFINDAKMLYSFILYVSEGTLEDNTGAFASSLIKENRSSKEVLKAFKNVFDYASSIKEKGFLVPNIEAKIEKVKNNFTAVYFTREYMPNCENDKIDAEAFEEAANHLISYKEKITELFMFNTIYWSVSSIIEGSNMKSFANYLAEKVINEKVEPKDVIRSIDDIRDFIDKNILLGEDQFSAKSKKQIIEKYDNFITLFHIALGKPIDKQTNKDDE